MTRCWTDADVPRTTTGGWSTSRPSSSTGPSARGPPSSAWTRCSASSGSTTRSSRTGTTGAECRVWRPARTRSTRSPYLRVLCLTSRISIQFLVRQNSIRTFLLTFLLQSWFHRKNILTSTWKTLEHFISHTCFVATHHVSVGKVTDQYIKLYRWQKYQKEQKLKVKIINFSSSDGKKEEKSVFLWIILVSAKCEFETLDTEKLY